MTLLPVLGNPGYKQRLHHTTILLYFKRVLFTSVYMCWCILLVNQVCVHVHTCVCLQVHVHACLCVFICRTMMHSFKTADFATIKLREKLFHHSFCTYTRSCKGLKQFTRFVLQYTLEFWAVTKPNFRSPIILSKAQEHIPQFKFYKPFLLYDLTFG